MNLIFLATVELGKLKIDEPEKFSMWLNQFIGKRVEVIVRKKIKKRTTGKIDELGNQNGWYYGVILPICSQELGYSIPAMHEIFTQEFAPFTFQQFNNKSIPIKIRTSQMNTMQFTQYIEDIRIKMGEMGITIPDPKK